MGATREHTAHAEGDRCPVCRLPWEEWPMAHKGDVVCGQACEKRQAAIDAGEPLPDPGPTDEPTADPSDC